MMSPLPALLLVGPTGAGKTPLGRLLEEKGFRGRPCLHFDFGAALRESAPLPQGDPHFTSAERAIIRTSLISGALLEDQDFPIALKVLELFLRARPVRPGGLLVLNGLPRHQGQAERLEPVVRVELVVFLDGSAEVIKERFRLDAGGDRVGRADSDSDDVDRRMKIFHDRTLPLLRFYEQRRVPVRRIPVTGVMTAGEMAAALREFD